jgi:hypothetical protein
MPARKKTSISGTPLEDVLAVGQGIERPFVCHVHNDTRASASVNVLKKVWYCFSCGARGMVDGSAIKAPSVAELEAMLAPERTARIYPDSYLDLFDWEFGNWVERLSDWMRWHARLGCDPITFDATFPVRTPEGRLAGVGRRSADPEADNRYRYPPGWSAANSLFLVGKRSDILVLSEGAGDTAGVGETGMWAAGCYGAGIHYPQIELIARLAPKLVVIAFDGDEAGDRAAYGWTGENGKHHPGAQQLIGHLAPVAIADWRKAGGKDPLEIPFGQRRELLVETVRASGYGPPDLMERLRTRAAALQADYAAAREEAA